MMKKSILGLVGIVAIGALLFGSNLTGYMRTGYNDLSRRANDAVPISFQIENAKNQLEKIDPEIKEMVWQIAKEKAQVKKLAAQVAESRETLKKQQQEMLTLRNHLDGGDKFYVATNGQAYTNERVTEDLAHRFNIFQTAEKTMAKSETILKIRESSLEAAQNKLEEAKAQKRELEVLIENLAARQKMNEVVATASKININNSQLSKTRQLMEDIDARLSAEEELLNLLPRHSGQIPVSGDEHKTDRDIISEFDAYFSRSSSSDEEWVNR